MGKLHLGILTFPLSKAGITPTSNLLKILNTLSNDITIITGDQGYKCFHEDKRYGVHGIHHRRSTRVIPRIVNYIVTQIRISLTMFRNTRHVDVWFFFIGGDCLLLPMLTARFLRKKVVLMFPGSTTLVSKAINDGLADYAQCLSYINCILSDKIILYSPRLISHWKLERFKEQIEIAHEHIMDVNNNNQTKPLCQRNPTIGFIGRFSREKGAFNFAESIPKILSANSNTTFVMIGEGELFEAVKKCLQKNGVYQRTTLLSWIPHHQVLRYLNECTLIVIPSVTEGLPNIMLEAISCGTPVLATPVGAIPDVISDGKTGFLLKDNSADCISRTVERIVSRSDLEQIAHAARIIIENEFTLPTASRRFKEIICNVICA